MEETSSSSNKVFVETLSLHPGVMFSTDLFLPDGTVFKEKFDKITLEDMRKLLSDNVKKIYYFQKKIEITHDDIHQVVKDIQQVNDFVAEYFYSTSHSHKDLSVEQFEKEMKERNIEFRLLSKLKKYDEETYHHSINVGLTCLTCGTYMNLNDEELERLSLAAFLHDIGKVFVPLELLKKPGKLTDEEYKIVKEHCKFSHQVLKRTKLIDERVLKIVAQHHERYDGSGYPKGLKGNEIDFYAQIIGLAEVFDAVTSPRTYKEEHPKEYALLLLFNMAGIKYSHKASMMMVKSLIRRFNIESLFEEKQKVYLNTKEVAEVIAENKSEVLLPMVEIIKMANGETPRRALIIDLAFDNQREIVCIEDKHSTVSLEKIYQVKQTLEAKYG